MFRAAITAGAGREHREQINLGKEFDEVARSNRTGFHEVLMSIAREAGAHEDVHHVMHGELGLADVKAARGGKRSGEVGVAAVVVIVAAEQPVRVRVTTSADDVVNPGAIGIPAVPAERIMGDGSHRAQVRQRAPEAVAGGEVGGVQCACLGAEEALREVGGVEEVEVTNLWAIDTEDTEEMTAWHLEGAAVTRGDQEFGDPGQTLPRGAEGGEVGLRQGVDRVAYDWLATAAILGVGGWRDGWAHTGSTCGGLINGCCAGHVAMIEQVEPTFQACRR